MNRPVCWGPVRRGDWVDRNIDWHIWELLPSSCDVFSKVYRQVTGGLEGEIEGVEGERERDSRLEEKRKEVRWKRGRERDGGGENDRLSMLSHSLVPTINPLFSAQWSQNPLSLCECLDLNRRTLPSASFINVSYLLVFVMELNMSAIWYPEHLSAFSHGYPPLNGNYHYNDKQETYSKSLSLSLCVPWGTDRKHLTRGGGGHHSGSGSGSQHSQSSALIRHGPESMFRSC